MSEPPTTLAKEWMLVCDTRGKPLYWVAADGECRDPRDQPPRHEWSQEMKDCNSDG